VITNSVIFSARQHIGLYTSALMAYAIARVSVSVRHTDGSL